MLRSGGLSDVLNDSQTRCGCGEKRDRIETEQTLTRMGTGAMQLVRREFLKSGAALVAAPALVHHVQGADRAGSRYNWGHTMDFGQQYHVRMLEIMEKIRRNEMNLVGDLSSRMAECLAKGGNVWMQSQVGHMPTNEFSQDHQANPQFLKSSTSLDVKMHRYDRMQPGDVLMTNYVNDQVQAVRERGVYVIGVPVCYIDNETAPRGYVLPNANDWLLGDVSSVILQSYIPHTQGIVDCPEIPEMKICPSSSNSLCGLYWMFQAEVANKFTHKTAKHVDKSALFLDTLLERVDRAYSQQKDYLCDHAAVVAKRIGKGGHYHAFSDPGAVGHEATGVAMGPMMTNAFSGLLKGSATDRTKGDVFLLACTEPDAAVIVKKAQESREKGIFVVSIGPGNSTQLRKHSDVFIDNFSPEGHGLIEIAGLEKKVATAGDIINNWLMWIFTAQFVDEMVRRGWVPWFWMGGFRVGGNAYNNANRPFFLEQGF